MQKTQLAERPYILRYESSDSHTILHSSDSGGRAIIGLMTCIILYILYFITSTWTDGWTEATHFFWHKHNREDNLWMMEKEKRGKDLSVTMTTDLPRILRVAIYFCVGNFLDEVDLSLQSTISCDNLYLDGEICKFITIFYNSSCFGKFAANVYVPSFNKSTFWFSDKSCDNYRDWIAMGVICNSK